MVKFKLWNIGKWFYKNIQYSFETSSLVKGEKANGMA